MEYPEWLIEGIFFLLGLLFGSFGNVIIYRMPLGKSVVVPRSHCMACGKQIPWFQNIPVLSWILLRGKCFSCGAKFSIRYPIVEILLGILFYLIYIEFGFHWITLEYCLFVFGLVVVSFIDIDHFILPDFFTLGGILLGLLGGALNPEREFLDSLLGVLLGGGFLWFVAYFYWILRKEEGMGGGDIKLLAWIGAVLGWKAIPLIILISSVSGTLVGLGIMMKKKGNLKTVIPFGPYLVMGALIYLLGSTDFSLSYFHFLFPSFE